MLYALGQSASARVSYRRYLALAGAITRPGDPWPGRADASGSRRPLEPYLLKRADRYLVDNIAERVSAAQIAKACGVSLRTLEKAFADFRGITPVAHARNLRQRRVLTVRAARQGAAAGSADFGRSSTGETPR